MNEKNQDSLNNAKSIKVLDKPVDIKLQMEYIDIHEKIDFKKYKDGEVLKMGEDLLKEKIKTIAKQKEVLILLAHLENIKAFHIIDRYLAITKKGKIRNWAILCFQEAYMFLAEDLLTGEQMMISTGAESKGNKLRYYFVISRFDGKKFSKKESSDISANFKHVCKELDSELENFEPSDNYILMEALVSIDMAVGELIEKGITICNMEKNIIKFHYYVNNIKKPTKKDIQMYLSELKNAS